MTRASARETFISHVIAHFEKPRHSCLAMLGTPSPERPRLRRVSGQKNCCAQFLKNKACGCSRPSYVSEYWHSNLLFGDRTRNKHRFQPQRGTCDSHSAATNLIPLREHAVDPITRVSSDEPLFDTLYSICDGDELSVTVLVKGAGSENVSALAMLEPTQDVTSFVLNTVCESGGKPCPPIIVGLGIGSTFDGSARLAK